MASTTASSVRAITNVVMGLSTTVSVLLVLTPVARVALSFVAFLRERDRMYVEITAIVLINLLIGFILGIA